MSSAHTHTHTHTHTHAHAHTYGVCALSLPSPPFFRHSYSPCFPPSPLPTLSHLPSPHYSFSLPLITRSPPLPFCRTTSNMSLLFCPCCGYKTLVRVVATVDAEGRRQLRPLSQKQFSKRGLKVNGDWSIWVGQCTVCVCLGGGGVGELWTFVDVVPQ